MYNNLFDFSFDNWKVVILAFFPVIINWGISLYAFLFLKRNKTNTAFSIFLFLLGLWQLAEGLAKISISSADAYTWYRISGGPALMMLPVGFMFTIRFTGLYKKINDFFLLVFLFLPAILFELYLIAGINSYIVKSVTWGWINNPEPAGVNIIIYYWMSLISLTMLGLFWGYYFKNRTDENLKTKALLLAIGFTFPTIGGTIVEAVFPLMLHIEPIPLATSLFTTFSVFSLIAIKKYNLLEYSPRHHWDQIVESMNEGILIVDNKDHIQYANESFCKLLGYNFSELKGKVAKELFLNDETQKKEVGKIIEDRKSKITSQYEMPLKTKDGKIVWMHISGSPYIDGRGKVVGSIGIQTNITHFKDAEKIHKYNEDRLKQGQELAHLGSWELNFSSKKSIWSDEACKIYGIPPDEKNDQSFESWFSFIHPDDLDFVKKDMEKSHATLSNASFKHRILLRNGKIKHIHSLSKFEFNDAGFPIGLFGACHDITEQVEAGKSLIESEENTRTFINESLLSICFINPVTKRISYSNSAFSELLGYSQKELELIPANDFIFNHFEEDIDNKMSELIQQKRINTSEKQWKRKDGRIVHVLVSSFYHKRNGKDAFYLAAQDITERKLAEEKLKETNLELKTFIYRASHDLRAPLASIIGLVNVSKLELKEIESTRYLEMIGSATERLDNTLGELVKAMQIKESETFSDQIDFNELVIEVLKKFSHFPGYDKLKVYLQIKINDSFISNRSILETIVQNLIENSIKYQKTDEKASFIKIYISRKKNNIELIVEDNGIGIEESLQSQIFDMYFRGNSMIKGSGLGLYLVKKGVDKLKGEIQIKSKPEIGTVFTILLPT